MAKEFRVNLDWSADHDGGTKFYEVITITEKDGFALNTNVIGHYGKLSLRDGERFRGKTTVYGTGRSAAQLKNEKKKGGYTYLKRQSIPLGIFDTLKDAVGFLEIKGMEFSAGDKYKLGLVASMADVRESALDDGSSRISSEPVTEARADLGAIVTTREENPWAGTW